MICNCIKINDCLLIQILCWSDFTIDFFVYENSKICN